MIKVSLKKKTQYRCLQKENGYFRLVELWVFSKFLLTVCIFKNNQKQPSGVSFFLFLFFLFFFTKKENNLLLVIWKGLFFCAFIVIMRDVEEWNLLVLGLFWEFLFWILSRHSLKNTHMNLLLRLLHWFIIRPSSSKLGRKSKAHPDKNLHNVHFSEQVRSCFVLILKESFCIFNFKCSAVNQQSV